jgi:hypothetical protein
VGKRGVDLKKILFICLAATAFMHLKSWAKDPYVDVNTTMCMEGEDIYISCAFNSSDDEYDYTGKVASICAKSNTSPDSGYVQYRYGNPSYGAGQAKIEMQFPEKKIPPIGIFSIYNSTNPESRGTALRFTTGRYLYSFESLNSFSYKVVARNQGEIVFNKSCTLPGKNYLIDDAYQGIPTIELGQSKISDTDK